ncbi:DoxX family protein [Oceanicella sp. SM1341]|uniref:DoxX family protein n=1 Tax=Oceanicella sp. SM1341 TaxID=1548889 RepID=UPI000E4A0A26|nr:DoxX family protein [Oceanicella sp. SM1341]
MIAPVLNWFLALAFLAGAALNATGLLGRRECFRRRGFPDRARHLVAALELVSAALLVIPATRVLGALLGGCLAAGALDTVVDDREWGHALAVLAAIALIVITIGND